MFIRIAFETYLGLASVLHVGHDLLNRVLRLGGVVGTAVKGDNRLPVLENLLRGEGNINGEAVAASSLPSSLAAPTATDLIETTSRVRALVTAESKDKRSNVVRLESLNHLLGHDGSGHGGTSIGSNGVDVDAVLVTLKSKGSRETKNTTFLNLSVTGTTHI
jgi:hypothetical protein